MRIAVIGGGLSGLAVAARLAHSGLSVTLFESKATVGGKAGELHFGGCRFDTGPSLLTLPHVVDELFATLGERREEHVTFHPLEILCRYEFSDGTILRVPQGPDAVAAAIASTLADDERAVLHYLERSALLYRLAAEFFLFRPLQGWLSFGRGVAPSQGLWALRELPHLGFGVTMHRLHCRHFADPRTIQLFDRYATYTGSDPYRCPATLALIPHLEHSLGAMAVAGGVYRLVEAIRDLALRQGVILQMATPVERIIVQNGRIRGVVAAGEALDFAAVVSAVDASTTYRKLLADLPSRFGKSYQRRQLSTSALVFYWVVRGHYPGLDVHNIFFSPDYRREFQQLGCGECPDDPTVYLYRSCAYAPTDAPPDSENWFVMMNVPPDGGQDWKNVTDRLRQSALRRLKTILGHDLQSTLLAEHVLTPPLIEKETGSMRGSLYGPASHGATATFLRQPNRSQEFSGLYFSGGSVHPGGGMPLALLSGALAAQLLLADVAGDRI